MSGIELPAYNGEYSYVGYLTVGEDTSMQVMLDTTTHKLFLANQQCSSCYTDGFIAKKYAMRERD